MWLLIQALTYYRPVVDRIALIHLIILKDLACCHHTGDHLMCAFGHWFYFT